MTDTANPTTLPEKLRHDWPDARDEHGGADYCWCAGCQAHTAADTIDRLTETAAIAAQANIEALRRHRDDQATIDALADALRTLLAEMDGCGMSCNVDSKSVTWARAALQRLEAPK